MKPDLLPTLKDPVKKASLAVWGDAQAAFRLDEMEGRSDLGAAVKKELAQNTVQFAESIGATVEDLRTTLEKSLQSEPFLKKSQILTDFWVDILKARAEMRRENLGVFKTERPGRSSESLPSNRDHSITR